MPSISQRMMDGQFDSRSRALFRMALGLLLLSQAILLSRDFAAFYQPGGVFPTGNTSQFPFLSPEVGTVLVHLLICIVIPFLACALVAGFFTRMATLGCFLSLIVVQGANPQILQGGDVLLRLLLLWSLFLSLGQAWSLDAWLKWLPRFSFPATTSCATWAFTLQICFVYWFAALLKSDPLWTHNGNALFYALNIEHFTTPFGLYLRQFPDLLRVLTFGTLCLEFIGPFLLLVPFRRDLLRGVAIVLFIGFHVGMLFLLRIGLFPWTCIIAWLIFIPGSAWNWLLQSRQSSPKIKGKKGRTMAQVPEEKTWPVPTWPVLDYVGTVLIIATLLDIFAWNVASLQGGVGMQSMKRYDVFGNFLHLDQRWNMYAPYPRSNQGWLVVPANLANGSQVDLFTGQTLSYTKPDDLGAYFGDDRWRRYLSNLFDDRDPQALQAYAEYLVHHWNQHHGSDEHVETVSIVFMEQTTMPDLTVSLPEQEVLYFQAY